MAGESAVALGWPRNSGTKSVTGSSSLSTPLSRSASTAEAVKLLVIEAIRNTVSAPGGGPPSQLSPTPPAWASDPPATIPYAMAGWPSPRWKLATTPSAAAAAPGGSPGPRRGGPQLADRACLFLQINYRLLLNDDTRPGQPRPADALPRNMSSGPAPTAGALPSPSAEGLVRCPPRPPRPGVAGR